MNLNPHTLRRVVPVLFITGAALVGCDNPAQPVNPTNSTIEEPRIDEEPEGNMVPPASTGDTPSTGVAP